MVWIFIIVHIVVCMVIGALIKSGRIQMRALVYPAVICIPVCGLLIFLVEWYVREKQNINSKEVMVDKLKISDAKYQRIQVEENELENSVVPLEEAIVVNDAAVRRKLMLDILHRNPEEHIDLLQKARLTDDTELTHYATTTMMEIQSNYEQRIRDLEDALEESENRVKNLRRLRRELSRYIESGMITGNILAIYQRKLGMVLEELLQSDSENKNYFLSKVENKLEQNDMVGIEAELKMALEKWPEDEKVYMLLVRYYQLTYQGEQIQKVLEDIEKNKVYLSSEGKKWFLFWQGKRI